jgi:hypothetical protein
MIIILFFVLSRSLAVKYTDIFNGWGGGEDNIKKHIKYVL